MTDLAQAEKRILELEAEVDRLAARVGELQAPFRRHAASHDLGAPIRFSVDDCKRIREKING